MTSWRPDKSEQGELRGAEWTFSSTETGSEGRRQEGKVVIERVTRKANSLGRGTYGGVEKIWRELESRDWRDKECLWSLSKRRRDSGRQIQYVTRGETTMVGGWPDTIIIGDNCG